MWLAKCNPVRINDLNDYSTHVVPFPTASMCFPSIAPLIEKVEQNTYIDSDMNQIAIKPRLTDHWWIDLLGLVMILIPKNYYTMIWWVWFINFILIMIDMQTILQEMFLQY